VHLSVREERGVDRVVGVPVTEDHVGDVVGLVSERVEDSATARNKTLVGDDPAVAVAQEGHRRRDRGGGAEFPRDFRRDVAREQDAELVDDLRWAGCRCRHHSRSSSASRPIKTGAIDG